MLNTLPFAIDEIVDQVGTTDGPSNGSQALNLDHLLGQKYEVDLKDGYGRREFLLVELNIATATFDVRGKVFTWDDDTTYKVAPCSGVGDRPVGVGYISLGRATVPDQAYFLVQTAGRCIVIGGDDVSGDPGAIDDTNKWVEADNDADLGKAIGTATYAKGATFGRYVSGTHTDSAQIVIDIIATLPG